MRQRPAARLACGFLVVAALLFVQVAGAPLFHGYHDEPDHAPEPDQHSCLFCHFTKTQLDFQDPEVRVSPVLELVGISLFSGPIFIPGADYRLLPSRGPPLSA